MRDFDVRSALHERELSVHRNEPNTLIIDELGIANRRAIVDVAVINGSIHGYEIKSERDSLDRLPSQIPVYNSALDLVTLVAAESHIKSAVLLIPEWWGIIVAKQVKETNLIEFVRCRTALANPTIQATDVVEFLWREEALDLLRLHGAEKGYKSKNRFSIYDRICELFTLEQIRDYVRETLKNRTDWRADALRTRGDG